MNPSTSEECTHEAQKQEMIHDDCTAIKTNKRRRTGDVSNNDKTTNDHTLIKSKFTLHPCPKNGLIYKNEFLSTYEKYQIVYFPQLLLYDKNNKRHGVGGDGENEAISCDVNGSTKDSQNITASRRIEDDEMKNDGCFHWRDTSSLFSKLNAKDQSSWTEEKYSHTDINKNGNKNSDINSACDDQPGALLHEDINSDNISAGDSFNMNRNNSNDVAKQVRAYSSFIVQHDKEAMKFLLNSLPIVHLPIQKYDENEKKDSIELMRMKYGPCIWFFYGRNDAAVSDTDESGERNNQLEHHQEPLAGRPEHTDSITHHGTWHYQLSGIKEWHLKPTDELLSQIQSSKLINKEELKFWNNNDGDDDDEDRKRLTISCQEGDVLLVNTRLWWHSTKIPQQPFESNESHPKRSVPSVSYARDIYLSWESNNDDDDDDDIIHNSNDGSMTNLDGLYASNDIEAGTIIFKEADMPDCELHRTRNDPNCEVVELEDGSGAVVSCRYIKAGEFFCLLESEDEDDDVFYDEEIAGSDFEQDDEDDGD